MKIVILGISQESLCLAHSILDDDPSRIINIYTEDAEAGFTGDPREPIVLKDALRNISSDWYGYIPESVDRLRASSTSSSWLVKALAIRLAERGTQFLLHTKILDIDEETQEISFRGGGSTASGTHRYDEMYDFRE